ncbi:MAG TPA: response regulator [Candidatus Limnocylindrales bacterium]|jgi:pilus assembly protein CpaE|nr:response regulator [Candidatus Limnocylindrales bacterium]
MADRIRVVIVDDIPETREHLTKLLGFEPDMEVVGSAGSGAEALEMADALRPNALLLDINMPEMDGIATAERLVSRAPTTAVIMMSVQGEADYLRRAMLAGAREFLVKPFSSDELVASIRQVVSREREKLSRVALSAESSERAEPDTRSGRMITLFAAKGGVGRTTLAVNLAAAAMSLGQRVVLVDGSLQFGDIGMMLNLDPKNKSIVDVARAAAAGEPDPLEGALVRHSTGLDVLMAPPSPEMAELVTSQEVERVASALRKTHDLIVVDAWPWLHDTTLAFLDQSDVILAMLTLEITSIKNCRQFLAVVDQLGYERDKVELLLNRSDAAYGIRAQDVERSIGRHIEHSIVSDGRTVVTSLNRGQPFVLAAPQAKVSQDVMKVARALATPRPATTAEKQSDSKAPAGQRRSLLAWR